MKRFSWSVIFTIAGLLILAATPLGPGVALAAGPPDEPGSSHDWSIYGPDPGPWPREDVTQPVDALVIDYVPGETYWGTNQYIQYRAGNLPIIISAPHGGYLRPDEIPDRTWGSRGQDFRSKEYTIEVFDNMFEITGGYPHVIINELHRIKLDANRDIGEAAQGDPLAEQAWHEFHDYIEDARDTVEAQYGRGHYFDFHTNGHDAQWVEMGLALTASDLNRSDGELDSATYRNKCTIRSLANTPGISFPEIVRGETSMGGLMEGRGFKSVPSPAYPHPGGEGYYYTGYNSWHHGSRSGGTIDGTQVETHYGFLPDDIRHVFSDALTESIIDFMEIHYGFDLREGGPVCVTDIVYIPAVWVVE